MGNMSYCRFENTSNDLQDCINHFEDDINGYEFKAREKIINLAKEILDNWGEIKFKELK